MALATISLHTALPWTCPSVQHAARAWVLCADTAILASEPILGGNSVALQGLCQGRTAGRW